MTTERRIDSDLPRILGDIAAGPYPDYIDDVLSTTAQRRQRPAWTFPERWFPMETVVAQASTARFPIRTIGVVALIAILIVAALAVYIGRRQPPLPAAPFGLAVNGQIAFAEGGDILAADQTTGAVTSLVTGPDEDSRPTFSPDGTMITFQREVSGGTAVVIAAADGRDTRVLTPEPLALVQDVQVSPDGEQALISAARDGTMWLALVGTDGSDFRWLETGGAAAMATYLPPDGASVLFVGGMVDTEAGQSIARVDLATGSIQTLVEAQPFGDIVGTPRSDPNGDRFVYSLWLKNAADGQARHFTMPTDGSAAPVIVPVPPDICCEGLPTWSNDGTRLAVNRLYDDRGVIAIVDAIEGGTGAEFVYDGEVASISFSPDDRYLLISSAGAVKEHIVLDAITAQPVEDPRANDGAASWQRIGSGS